MLASVHTAVQGWDVVVALLVVVAALVLAKVVPQIAWVALGTLFVAALIASALLFTY